MLSFKPEVRVGIFSCRLGDVLGVVSTWSVRHRVDVHVSSINDGPGVHMATSLHYFDLALDLDVINDKPEDRFALAEHLRRWLDPHYDVVFEADHVHVEWDAHRPPLRAAAPPAPQRPAMRTNSSTQSSSTDTPTGTLPASEKTAQMNAARINASSSPIGM